MKFRSLASLFVFSVAILFSLGSAFAQSPYKSGTIGNDLSWPNCATAYTVNGKFGIIGVDDGLNYSMNPCLSKEVSQFPGYSLYASTGWYSKSAHINSSYPLVCPRGNENCLAYNYGYNAGLYAYASAASEGVHAVTWWLDVEKTYTWSSNPLQNQNSLRGEHDALVDEGVTTVGIYSTTVQWDNLTGNWLNNWPSWGASTWTTAADAKTFCKGHEFTGGPTLLIQYIGKIDQDYAC
jgi:hypothetical protein